MNPHDHRGVGPFAKKGHMRELNRKRKRKMKRRRHRFLSDLDEKAVRTTPELTAAIYKG
jgi:hypothetical protein